MSKMSFYTANFLFSLWKKNTRNEHMIAHFDYIFSCHYSMAIWLAENLNKIKIPYYGKIFSHIKQKFSHFEKGLGIKNIFWLTITIIFTEIHRIKTKPKNNFETIELTNIKYIPHTPRRSSLKGIAFSEFKLPTLKLKDQIGERTFFEGFSFKILNITEQI